MLQAVSGVVRALSGYTIGLHGPWAPETARQETKVQFGRVARGDDPAEVRQLDHKATAVK